MKSKFLAFALVALFPFVAGQVSAAPASESAPAPMATTYSVDETEVGVLIDAPAAKAVLDKYVPGFAENEKVEMARGLTLRSLQQFAPETFTDELLAQIDADLKKL